MCRTAHLIKCCESLQGKGLKNMVPSFSNMLQVLGEDGPYKQHF